MSEDFFAPGHVDSPYVLKLKRLQFLRKARPCIWCGLTITQWEGAVYRVAKYDQFETDYWHVECWQAQEYLPDYAFDPGSQPRGEVNEETLYPPFW